MANSNKEREFELYNQFKVDNNKSAKKELIHSLTPLIRSQVGKYKNSGLPYASLELEGRRLTSQAIDSYDPKMGTQLNTHVMTHLQKLSRFTNTYQNVGYIPEPRALMIGRYNTMFDNLQAEKGREPTVFELSDSMFVPPAEIERLQLEQRNDLHMELPAADSEEGGFSYYVAPSATDPKVREALQFVYFDTEPVNKKILEYTFGMGGTPKINASEIKVKLNLTETEFRKRKNILADQIKELMD